MARSWNRVDLEGTRNGSNTVFDIPSLPGGAYPLVIHNTRMLREVGSSPGATQYTISGATVTLGLAPEASDDLWARVSWDTPIGGSNFAFDGLPQHAPALLKRVAKTFPFSVRILDKAGNMIEYIDDDVSAIQWRYNALGGCADASITLRRPFDAYWKSEKFGVDYGVEIWREIDTLGVAGARLDAVLPMELGTAFSGTQERRWGGFIREIEPVLADDESVELRCSGFSRQMEYIIVPAPAMPWQSMDIAAIVRDIIDTYVVPGTQVKRTPALNLVPDVGVTLANFTGESSALQMIAILGELAGNAEWGVRADREFFFAQRTSQVKQTHIIGDRVLLYRTVESSDEIITKVYVRTNDGTRYDITHVNHEAGYGKERLFFLPQLFDQNAAELWGTSYFARFANSQPSGRVTLGETDDWIEGVQHPLGLLRVVGGPVFVSPGEPLPDQLPMQLGVVYGAYTDQSFRINSITYRPTEDALQIDVELGERSNHIADYLRRIEYRLAELAQGLTV